jgi:hypothetical protein
MSKRLQVLFDETEYRQLKRMAKRKGMTVADWVRHAVRAAAQEQPVAPKEKKLAAIRAAMTHRAPTADITQMLEEIERGYGSDVD